MFPPEELRRLLCPLSAPVGPTCLVLGSSCVGTGNSHLVINMSLQCVLATSQDAKLSLGKQRGARTFSTASQEPSEGAVMDPSSSSFLLVPLRDGQPGDGLSFPPLLALKHSPNVRTIRKERGGKEIAHVAKKPGAVLHQAEGSYIPVGSHSLHSPLSPALTPIQLT